MFNKGLFLFFFSSPRRNREPKVTSTHCRSSPASTAAEVQWRARRAELCLHCCIVFLSVSIRNKCSRVSVTFPRFRWNRCHVHQLVRQVRPDQSFAARVGPSREAPLMCAQWKIVFAARVRVWRCCGTDCSEGSRTRSLCTRPCGGLSPAFRTNCLSTRVTCSTCWNATVIGGLCKGSTLTAASLKLETCPPTIWPALDRWRARGECLWCALIRSNHDISPNHQWAFPWWCHYGSWLLTWTIRTHQVLRGLKYPSIFTCAKLAALVLCSFLPYIPLLTPFPRLVLLLTRWYFGTMNRHQAQCHLLAAGNQQGAFLMRQSEKDGVGIVLSGEERTDSRWRYNI